MKLSEESRELRVVHGLRVEIDRDICVGYADCVTESATSFDLDDEGIAVFVAPESATCEELLAACDGLGAGQPDVGMALDACRLNHRAP